MDHCDEGRSSENDTPMEDLLEKSNILSEEIRALKGEHEIQIRRLC